MGGFIRFTVFTLLYLSTLIVNVVSNEIVLKLTSQINGSLMIAFLIATSLSATLNFIGMKYIVFNAQKGSK
jgi:putative flippase GtrA